MLKWKKSNELISVIVPIYNVENYLEDCINSIINQTYKNIEIILVDDGSTDSSGELCDCYAKKDSRIVVIHKENGGLSDARNTGIKRAKGNYVSLIDSDDFICNNFIQTLYEIQRESDSDLVCCELINFYNGEEKKVYEFWDKINSEHTKYVKYDSNEIIEKSFYQHVSITGAHQKLYKKKMFEHIEFPVGRYFEDLATTFLFFKTANHVSVINKKLYAYRMRPDSIMNCTFNERKMDCIWVSDRIESVYVNSRFQGYKCAVFRVNRLVYDQIPFRNKEDKNAVWKKIQQYRFSVLKDKNVQFYEKIIALSSFSGKYIFELCLYVFRFIRKIKYKKTL